MRFFMVIDKDKRGCVAIHGRITVTKIEKACHVMGEEITWADMKPTSPVSVQSHARRCDAHQQLQAGPKAICISELQSLIYALETANMVLMPFVVLVQAKVKKIILADS